MFDISVNTLKVLGRGWRFHDFFGAQTGTRKEGKKEILQHIRTNTNAHNKALQNLMWEVQELRTGGKEKESGNVSGQGGSLLALLGVAIDNQGTNISENLIKMGQYPRGCGEGCGPF